MESDSPNAAPDSSFAPQDTSDIAPDLSWMAPDESNKPPLQTAAWTDAMRSAKSLPPEPPEP